MILGEQLKQARLEAGLSQRQLCGEKITRNMLSQIEHGTAKPSMDTLVYLAQRLGKPVSVFLEEQPSPNLEAIQKGREALRRNDPAGILSALEDFQEPDPVLEEERKLLLLHGLLGAAEQATAEKRYPYARELLARAEEVSRKTVYSAQELEGRRQLLAWEIPGAERQTLPSLDRELLIRAEAALEAGQWERCLWLLGAAEDQASPRWNYLRGRLAMEQKDFPRAAQCLAQVETAYPGEVIPWLETCFRELGDFQQAYRYACMQKASRST